jgi:hypothetical protein
VVVEIVVLAPERRLSVSLLALPSQASPLASLASVTELPNLVCESHTRFETRIALAVLQAVAVGRDTTKPAKCIREVALIGEASWGTDSRRPWQALLLIGSHGGGPHPSCSRLLRGLSRRCFIYDVI